MKRYIKAKTVKTANVLTNTSEVDSILQSIANKPLWIHVYVKNYNGGGKSETWIRIHYAEPTDLGIYTDVSFWAYCGGSRFLEGDKLFLDRDARSMRRPSSMIQIIEPVTIINEDELRQKDIAKELYPLSGIKY